MSARLTPLLRERSTPTIWLQRPIILIGRHPECDVQVDRPQISRFHCCVGMAYDRVVIRDLGSRNGLRVNGRLIEETLLRSGDEVAIGPIIYRMEAENQAPASKAKPSADSLASTRGPSDPVEPDDELVPLSDP